MKPEEFAAMLRKGTKSLRLANAKNTDLPGMPPTVDSLATAINYDPTTLEAMRKMVAAGMRPNSDESKLNQLETRYLRWLETLGDAWIGIQCLTFKAGHDMRYTPDFVAIDATGIRCIDTKGEHTWEDSLIKIRATARMFPFVRFLIAKDENGVWKHIEIKP